MILMMTMIRFFSLIFIPIANGAQATVSCHFFFDDNRDDDFEVKYDDDFDDRYDDSDNPR